MGKDIVGGHHIFWPPVGCRAATFRFGVGHSHLALVCFSLSVKGLVLGLSFTICNIPNAFETACFELLGSGPG